MKEIVLATDLGGTNLRMAAIDREGNVLYQTKRETPRTENANEVIDSMIESAEDCLLRTKGIGEAIAISAAVPSGVDYQNGIIIKAPNLPCLNNFPMSEVLEKELKLKVILENDSNAAAVGESWIGAAKGFQDSVTVTLGTGVGSGIIINGGIFRGIDGLAGEIGHVCVEPNGNPCVCSSLGCLEQYTSATAIVRQTHELEIHYPNSSLKDNPRLTSADVYQAGKAGDELALEAFRRMGFYLGIGLSGLINTLNPEVIVLGGGASSGWDLFMPTTEEQIRIRAHRVSAERAKIVPAMLGDDAGILGAAKLGFLESNLARKVNGHGWSTLINA